MWRDLMSRRESPRIYWRVTKSGTRGWERTRPACLFVQGCSTRAACAPRMSPAFNHTRSTELLKRHMASVSSLKGDMYFPAHSPLLFVEGN
jgi:hypothetical protein